MKKTELKLLNSFTDKLVSCIKPRIDAEAIVPLKNNKYLKYSSSIQKFLTYQQIALIEMTNQHKHILQIAAPGLTSINETQQRK